MRSDLDEQDLYPPDAEDTELTAEAKNHRLRAAVGATLLTWGMSLVIELTLGLDLDTFVLGIGIGALAGWSQLRRYNWFAVGSIATGLGAAEVTGAVIGGAFGSTVASLLVAAGFAAIYVRYPRRSMWALVPAAIMALIAAGAFGVGLIGLLPAMFGRFLLPLLLVGGGALLLFRHSLPPKTVKVGLAALAVTFVLVGTTSVPEIDRDDPNIDLGVDPPRRVGQVREIPLDIGPGDTIVLGGGGHGDIEFSASADGTGHIAVSSDERQRSVPQVRRDGDRVLVGMSGGNFFGSTRGVSYRIALPAGVRIDVERDSGSVTGTLAGISGVIRTDDGNVDLKLTDGGAEGVSDDGPLEIATDSGDVTIVSEMVLDLSLRSEDDVEVNDVNKNGRYLSPAGIRGIPLSVDSERGDIRVTLPDSATTTTGPDATPTAPTTPTAGD